MQLDAEVDQAYPQRWIGKVTVRTRDGRSLSARVDEPKGDPGNTLTRAELEDKAQRLAAYGQGATPAEMQALIARIWAVAEAPHIERWLAA
jgi:2-methylcitrate dehydratase PrpD